MIQEVVGLRPPRLGTVTNEELCESTSNQCGLCRPTQLAAANAAFLPTIRCSGSGNGSLYFGRCEPDEERYGAVFNSMAPPGASTRLASLRYASGFADMLDDGMRQDEIECAILERQRSAVGVGESDVRDAFLCREAHTNVAKAFARLDADHRSRLFRERHAHAAAAAPIVQHAIESGDSGLFKIGEHLRAAPVFEYGVVVFRSEPHGRVPAYRGVVYDPHA